VISSQSLVGCLAVDVKLALFHWSLILPVPPSWARFVREMFCISGKSAAEKGGLRQTEFIDSIRASP
jgi:hypothetical protein